MFEIIFSGVIIGSSAWVIVPMLIGLVVPVIFMTRYHAPLVKEYVITEQAGV